MQDMNLSRRRISALVLVPLALLLGAACNPLGPPKSTVASVDVERFSGTWYEVAKVNRKTVTVRGWLFNKRSAGKL